MFIETKARKKKRKKRRTNLSPSQVRKSELVMW